MYINWFRIRRTKEKLAFYARLLGQKGLTFSCFGNISLRLANQVLIKNRGVNLELAKPEDFSLFSLDKNLTPAEASQISSEWKLHFLSYQNTSHRAIFHLHPFYLSLLDRLNLNLEFEDLESKYLIQGKIKILPELEPASQNLAQAVAESLRDFPILLLKGHGIVVAGNELAEAYNCSLGLEITAKRIFYHYLTNKS